MPHKQGMSKRVFSTSNSVNCRLGSQRAFHLEITLVSEFRYGRESSSLSTLGRVGFIEQTSRLKVKEFAEVGSCIKHAEKYNYYLTVL